MRFQSYGSGKGLPALLTAKILLHKVIHDMGVQRGCRFLHTFTNLTNEIIIFVVIFEMLYLQYQFMKFFRANVAIEVFCFAFHALVEHIFRMRFLGFLRFQNFAAVRALLGPQSLCYALFGLV